MTPIHVPKPASTPEGKEQFAIEVALNALLEKAGAPRIGLLYLPDQELTRNFQEACRAILSALQANKKGG